MRFTSPSGQSYTWDDAKGPPQQSDVDAIVAYDAQLHPQRRTYDLPGDTFDERMHNRLIKSRGESVYRGAGASATATQPQPQGGGTLPFLQQQHSTPDLWGGAAPKKSWIEEMGLAGPEQPSIAMRAPSKREMESDIAKLPFTKEELTASVGNGIGVVSTRKGGKISTDEALALWDATGAPRPHFVSHLDDPEFYRSLYGKLPPQNEGVPLERTGELQEHFTAGSPTTFSEVRRPAGSSGLIGHGEEQYSPTGQYAPGSPGALFAARELAAQPQLAKYNTVLGTASEVANFASYFVPVFGEARFSLEMANSIAKGDPSGLVNLIPLGIAKVVERAGGFKLLKELWQAHPDNINAMIKDLSPHEQAAMRNWAKAPTPGEPPTNAGVDKPAVVNAKPALGPGSRSGEGVGSPDVGTGAGGEAEAPTGEGTPELDRLEAETGQRVWKPPSKQGGGTSLFGGRKGSAFDPEVYKDLGEKISLLVDSVNTAVGGGIKALQRYSPETANAFARFAAARQAAHTTINDTVRLGDKFLGKGNTVKQGFPALMQGRLYALRQDAAARLAEVNAMGVHDTPDESLAAHAAGEKTFERNYPGSLAEIKVRGFGAGHEIESLMAEGRFAEAKQAAINALESGVDPGNDLMSRQEYDKIRSNPMWGQFVQTYKANLEAEMADWHALHGGWKTEILGADGAFIPLVRDQGGQLSGQPVAYRAPKNMANRQATGTSQYTSDIAAFEHLVAGRFKASGKANFLAELQKSGLVREATDADYPKIRVGMKDRNSLTMTVNGVKTPAVVRTTSPIMLINKKTGAFFAPAKGIVVPKWLDSEVSPLLNRMEVDQFKVMQVINKAAVSGYAEPIYHFFGGGGRFWSTAAGRPVQAAIGFFKNIADYNTPESAAKRAEMAKMGVPANVRPLHLGDPESGWKNGWINPFRKIVFGDRGTDSAMRTTLYDIAKSMGAKTPQEYRDFINPMGTYVYGLDSAWERGLKRSGFAPFATAAKSQVISGVKSVIGATPIPGGKPGVSALYWAKRQAFGGGLGFVAGWVGLHKLFTGQYPWQSNTPFGMVPLGNGRMLNMTGISPTNAVGFKVTGITGAYNASQSDATAKQTRDEILKDMINEGASIVSGSPTLRFGTRALFGVEPTLTDLADRQGRPEEKVLQTSPGEGAGDPKNLAYAALQSNPITGIIATEAGFTAPWKQRQIEAEPVLDRMVDASLQVFLPRVTTPMEKTLDPQQLANLNQREAEAKKGGEPLSTEEARRLAELRIAHADKTPKSKRTKMKPDEVDQYLRSQGRGASGYKTRGRTGEPREPRSGGRSRVRL